MATGFSSKFSKVLLSVPAKVVRAVVPEVIANQLSFEVRSALGRRFAKRLKIAPGDDVYIDLGAADSTGGNFVGIDFFGNKRVYGADLRYPLLIDDAVVAGVFSEHTLEHLTFSEARNLIAECFRILRPGGRIRVVVPDVGIFARRYVAGDMAWFREWEKEMLERRGRKLYTKMQAISFVTQEYGHRSAWDFETLNAVLSDTGFVDITECEFGHGGNTELLRDRDLRSRVLTSVYVEAVKLGATINQ